MPWITCSNFKGMDIVPAIAEVFLQFWFDEIYLNRLHNTFIVTGTFSQRHGDILVLWEMYTCFLA